MVSYCSATMIFPADYIDFRCARECAEAAMLHCRPFPPPLLDDYTHWCLDRLTFPCRRHYHRARQSAHFVTLFAIVSLLVAARKNTSRRKIVNFRSWYYYHQAQDAMVKVNFCASYPSADSKMLMSWLAELRAARLRILGTLAMILLFLSMFYIVPSRKILYQEIIIILHTLIFIFIIEFRLYSGFSWRSVIAHCRIFRWLYVGADD